MAEETNEEVLKGWCEARRRVESINEGKVQTVKNKRDDWNGRRE